MRNLTVSRISKRRLWKEKDDAERVHFAVWADLPGTLFVCHNLKIVQIDLSGETDDLFDLRDQVPTIEQTQILDLFFLSFQRKLCLALSTGEVILYDIDNQKVTFAETELNHPQGLKAISASPDHELIAAVTTDDKLFLYDCIFDVVNETYLRSSEFGEGEFMTVGWGKKETQFHGSEGKQAAHKSNQFEIGVDVDYDSCRISWRGDGLYFAVGFVANSNSHFKVYNKEGILQYTSEKQSGLECKFSWRPSGNLIATSQIFPNKYVVAFFEKNGLKHGELILPFKREDVFVKDLSWSGDSEVLCVFCENNSTKDNFIYMYTSNNYHWYLKQTFQFPFGVNIMAMKWEEPLANDMGKCLHLVTADGVHEKVEWIQSIDRSTGKNDRDGAHVGVIDGQNLLITGFKYSVVPPPMASNTIQCEFNVNKLLFGPTDTNTPNLENGFSIDSNSVCAFMENGSCSIYALDNRKFKCIGTTSPDFLKNVKIVNNAVWLTEDRIMWANFNGKTSFLHVINVSYEPELSMQISNSIELNEGITGIKSIPDKLEVVLQCNTGKLLHYELNGTVKDFDISLPEYCNEFDVVNVDQEYIVLGLTSRNRFYINDIKIANNITSYFVHSDFLIFTTLQHQLLTCPLISDDIKNLQKDQWCNKNIQIDQNENEFLSRRIERGAYLVTAVARDSRTILQMPRGNIEVIQPRALSLKIIGDFLDRKEYDLAFDLMRRQRINLNLIYDHNPELFLESIPIFINKINNSNWLSLFISDLDNQDVKKTMYLGAYKNSTKSTQMIKEKVRSVCEKIREYLEDVNENNKFLLPILTTHVKLNTVNDLENALIRIKEVKDNTKNEDIINANDALKYLLYMVNVEELYNIALGLYDFDLVMFVAHKSQKDPKEYIPYINKLKTMDEDYMKFSIDNDLKRYESALKHLIKCNKDRNELLSFIKQHCLYSKALYQIESNDNRYVLIAEEFGKFLYEKRHYTEAAMMYVRSDNKEKALECFVEALEYQSAINLAFALKYSDEKILDIKNNLIKKLKEVGKYQEIINILSDSITPDVVEMMRFALEGRLYKTSLNVCYKYGNLKLIDTILRPAIIEQQNILLNTINQNMIQFEKQRDRLLIVRQNKAKKLAVENLDENLHPECDLYSDTSSIMGSTGSRSSGRSHRSSKNRRKHERKMVSLKEGSRFEDVALIRALHTLVTVTFNLRQDVEEIFFVLRWLSYDDEIICLQKALDHTLSIMSGSFDTIWIPELNMEANKTLANELKNQDITMITDASFTLEPYIRIPPIIQEKKWKMEYL